MNNNVEVGSFDILKDLKLVNKEENWGKILKKNKIMSEEEIGYEELMLKFGKKRKRGWMKMNVEIGKRLIEDNKIWIKRKGKGNKNKMKMKENEMGRKEVRDLRWKIKKNKKIMNKILYEGLIKRSKMKKRIKNDRKKDGEGIKGEGRIMKNEMEIEKERINEWKVEFCKGKENEKEIEGSWKLKKKKKKGKSDIEEKN